jgi:hypothetical protein
MLSDALNEINEVYERWKAEKDIREARRNKMKYIDSLLNQVEELNLADKTEIPDELHAKILELIDESDYPLPEDFSGRLSVNQALDILFDIQDMLMCNQIEEE